MPREIRVNEATAAKRRVYFDLRDATDGITAEVGEAAGQPQISTNGAAFTNTGIGTLTAIGTGRYYADLTQATTQTVGNVIETRYKSAATVETPGDTLVIVERGETVAQAIVDVTLGGGADGDDQTIPIYLGQTGLTLGNITVTMWKTGMGGFGAVTNDNPGNEIGGGWYEWTATATEADTEGAALVKATDTYSTGITVVNVYEPREDPDDGSPESPNPWPVTG